MPLYPGPAGATARVAGQAVPVSLSPGGRAYLFGVRKVSTLPLDEDNLVGEVIAAGASSIATALYSGPIASVLRNVGVEIIFSANPGVFNIQIQEADTDADGAFLTPAAAAFTITLVQEIGVSGIYIARVDLGTIGSKFIRLFCDLNPNAVSLIAKVTLQ